MRDGAGFLVLGAIVIAIVLIVWIANLKGKAKLYYELEPKLRNLDTRERQLQMATGSFEASKALEAERRKREEVEHLKRLEQDRAAINRLASEKSVGFPWLVSAIADYFWHQDNTIAHDLESKDRPAMKAALAMRKISARRREAERESRKWKYKATYYEGLVPWLSDAFDKDFGEILDKAQQAGRRDVSDDEKSDPVFDWLSPEEYRQLPEALRNQRALDVYVKRKKSNWEIGRDYERYVGFKYEESGCSVIYHGIVEGLDDLGRDVIAKSGKRTFIVQCKYWSDKKTIYEKHICQLVGTAIEYALDIGTSKANQLDLLSDVLRERDVTPVFYTSTALSERARKFAKALRVEVHESYKLGQYPMIKCNIARQSGERIYHLPFDQQYDLTVIEPSKGESYAWSVKEAEDNGFRRAWRWRPERGD